MDPIIYTTKPSPDSLPGFFESTESILFDGPKMKHLDNLSPNEAFIIENALSASDCEKLINYMNTSDNFEEVGVQGMKDQKDERIGSVRTSIWSPQVALQIWDKIHNFLPMCNPHSKTSTYFVFIFYAIFQRFQRFCPQGKCGGSRCLSYHRYCFW